MTPFQVSVSDATLDDLKTRLTRTRWPDDVEGGGWEYGTDLTYMRELVRYWVSSFDWRAQEARLNGLPQFRATLRGLGIHFVHVRGKGPRPFPLILTHGWPSTFAEMYGLVGPLTDPASYGGDPADSFDVVIPSYPGHGFSDAPRRKGGLRTEQVWRELMVDLLGYRRFGAHGVDIGARTTSALGRDHGDVVAGIHIATVDLDWPDPMPAASELSDDEREYLRRVGQWEKEEGAYLELQATRPQTAAFALNDSPAGLAAWIVEKFRSWSACGGDIESRFSKDELLTTVMIYWVTRTIAPSMRRYFDARHYPSSSRAPVRTPTGIAMFPGERLLVVPRSWAARAYNIKHWTTMPSGGHFPAFEEPQSLVTDIRTFFRQHVR